jgi:hypothetical protein
VNKLTVIAATLSAPAIQAAIAPGKICHAIRAHATAIGANEHATRCDFLKQKSP